MLIAGSGTCLLAFSDFDKLVSHALSFFLWSTRVSGLHQGSGILRLLFPIIVFLLVPGLVSRVSALVSRLPGLLEPSLPSLCFFLWFIRAPRFLVNLSPIIVLVLWSIRARDFIRVPGFLDFCLPSLCFFLWFIRAPGFLEPSLASLCLFCGPSGRGTSSGFRESWTFVSHHCVSSGSGTCLPSCRTCLPDSGTCGTLSPMHCSFFLLVYEGSGILKKSQQQSL